MIEITNIENDAPRAVEKARRTKPYVTKLSESTYRVVPRAYPKQKRFVTLKVVGDRRFADCRDFYTDAPCPAVDHEMTCYHIGAVARRLKSNEQRERKRAAAAVVATPVIAAPRRPLPDWYGATKIRGIRI